MSNTTRRREEGGEDCPEGQGPNPDDVGPSCVTPPGGGHVCPGGVEVEEDEACPEQPGGGGGHVCPGGVEVEEDEACPEQPGGGGGHVCPGGVEVEEDEACPVVISPTSGQASPSGLTSPNPVLISDPLPWILIALGLGGGIGLYAKIKSGRKIDDRYHDGKIEITTEGGVEE